MLSPDLVVGAMSYISVFGCDICGGIVVSLLGRVGVYICMCVGVKKWRLACPGTCFVPVWLGE